MVVDKAQKQRFELKYVISEEVAAKVREFVRTYLSPDEHAIGKINYSYPVHSLYLDSPDMKLYRDTINGLKNRFKLRIRYYNDNPSAPVFFEVKRRTNNTISKLRGQVHRHAIGNLLRGHLPSPSDLADSNPEAMHAAQEFSRRMLEVNGEPKSHVAYDREAWVPDGGNAVRVTMDRLVLSEPCFEAMCSTQMKNPLTVFGDRVILELKFTDRFPGWMRDMVLAFNLRQRSAGKYVDGVQETTPGTYGAWHAAYA